MGITQYISLFKQLYFQRSFVRTSATATLSFKILGDPTNDLPPILLLHGLLGHKKHWDGLGKMILNLSKRKVIAVDLRNHGESPHVSTHTYPELASDVLELLKKLQITRASLIGHSMGGRTAMCVSLMAPEKVCGVLIIDISPVSTSTQLTGFFPKVLAGMKQVDLSGITAVGKAREKAKQQLTKIITDDVTMRAVLSNINPRPDGTLGWICNVDVLISSFGDIASFPADMVVKKYDGPTLFLGGQLSDFIPADDLPGIKATFPQAVIKYIAKAGHNVHADNPKAFVQEAVEFVKPHNK